MSFYPPPLFRARVENKQCNALVNCSLSVYKVPRAAAKQKLVWSIKKKIVDKLILLYCEHLIKKKIKRFPPLEIPQSVLLVHIPRRILSSWQRRKSQILTVPSSEHVANLLSVGEKLLHEDTQQGKEVSI